LIFITKNVIAVVAAECEGWEFHTQHFWAETKFRVQVKADLYGLATSRQECRKFKDAITRLVVDGKCDIARRTSNEGERGLIEWRFLEG
jgi:hypothetical protein